MARPVRIEFGVRRMTEVAREYGYRDGSGVHRVLQRLEARASSDRQLETLAAKVPRSKS